MKKSAFSLILTLAVVMITGNFIAVAETTNPLAGKIIALDAGHGGGESGAVNQTYQVAEADVNGDVVIALEAKLAAEGANVVIADRLSTRRDRVADAVNKCQAIYGRKCDVLISVHHNGNTDQTHDGTLVIYNEKQDIPLAQALHDSLLPLTNNDEGYLHGGYGITVYKNLVSALTEAYYITNDEKAARYLNDLNADGVSNLVLEEADAQVKGISDYFTSQTGGKGGKPR